MIIYHRTLPCNSNLLKKYPFSNRMHNQMKIGDKKKSYIFFFYRKEALKTCKYHYKSASATLVRFQTLLRECLQNIETPQYHIYSHTNTTDICLFYVYQRQFINSVYNILLCLPDLSSLSKHRSNKNH